MRNIYWPREAATPRRERSLHATLLAASLTLMLAATACGGDAGNDKGAQADDSSETDSKDAGKATQPGKVDAAAPGTSDAKDAAIKPAKKDAGAPPDKPTDPAGPSGPSDAGKPGTGTTSTTPGATGPDDGDPSKPTVTLPDVPCSMGAGAGFGTANLKVGERDVILTYPCGKHEGANMSFILLLHGTMATENIKFYTHSYFAAYSLASTHNLIIAEPKSLASQWGNTMENPDASKDKQHLLDVIDYVYTNLGKFNINSLWVAGHSWGAFYAKQFICDTTIMDKARGVIGMSGGTGLPGPGFGASGNLTPTKNCADYISQIHTVGDMDMVNGLPDQTKAATAHGCAAKVGPTDIGKMQMLDEWPNCQPGWVHEDFTMGSHTHTTAINPEVVKQIVEKVKAADKH